LTASRWPGIAPSFAGAGPKSFSAWLPLAWASACTCMCSVSISAGMPLIAFGGSGMGDSDASYVISAASMASFSCCDDSAEAGSEDAASSQLAHFAWSPGKASCSVEIVYLVP